MAYDLAISLSVSKLLAYRGAEREEPLKTIPITHNSLDILKKLKRIRAPVWSRTRDGGFLLCYTYPPSTIHIRLQGMLKQMNLRTRISNCKRWPGLNGGVRRYE